MALHGALGDDRRRKREPEHQRSLRGLTAVRFILLALCTYALFVSILSLDFLRLLPIRREASFFDGFAPTASGVPPCSRNNDRSGTKCQKNPPVTIAYTIAITKCVDERKKKKRDRMLDGAAVLKQSIQHVSKKSKKYFNFDMIAVTHDEDVADYCRDRLRDIGYKIVNKPSPVALHEIRNKKYADLIKGSGCCGEKEFLKLYGYNMTEYSIVVQLDLDTLILRPFDELFDAMLTDGTLYPESELANSPRTIVTSPSINGSAPTVVNAFFTRDYSSNVQYKDPEDLSPPNRIQIQGGMLILRPNPAVLDEFIGIIKEGDFLPGRGWGPEGWGGSRVGSGASDRFQGIVSFYYSGLHPNTGVDLHPCYYYSNAAPPRSKSGRCTTTESTCEDCRRTNFSDVFSFHFGGCLKPWECPFPDAVYDPFQDRGDACLLYHHAWHRTRYEFEKSHSSIAPSFNQTPDWYNVTDYYFGHCHLDDDEEFGYKYAPIDRSLFTSELKEIL